MTLSRSEAGKLGALKSKETNTLKLLQRIQNYNLNKKECIFCLHKLEYEDRHKKFCNQSCAAKFNNEKRKIYTICAFCETHIATKNRRKKQRFCSSQCHHNFIKEQNYKEFVLNKETNFSHKLIRSLLIYKNGAQCVECGWNKVNPVTGNCPIELDHKDGNSNNNSFENVRLLCPNCHSLTPTYKALNKGNGRKSRKK